MARRKLTPHARIMRAALSGTGCRLSTQDCIELSMDQAIETRGLLDLDAHKAGKDPYSVEDDNEDLYVRRSDHEDTND